LSEQRKPQVLHYARAQQRDQPLIVQFVLAAAWLLILFFTYGLAIGAPFVTNVALYVLFTEQSVRAFGEPVETTWQKVRFVAYPAGLTVVFTPLAIWLGVWIRKNADSGD